MTTRTPAPEPAPAADAQRTTIIVVPRHTVHWVIAGLLAVIATCLLLRGGDGLLGGSPAWAQNMLGARGLFAFTGQIDKDKFGLWMLDVDAGTVWCYEYNPIKKRMHLVAGRTFVWDRYLKSWNQDDPTPEQVQQILDQERQLHLNMQGLNQNLGAVIPASQPNNTAVPAVSGS